MRIFILVLVLIISCDAFAQIGKSQIGAEITEVGGVERLLGNYYTLYTLSYIEVEPGLKTYILSFTNEYSLYDKNVTDPSKIISTEQRMLIFDATQEEFNYFHNFLEQGFNGDQIRSLEVGQDVVKTLPRNSKFLYVHVDFKDGTSASLKLKKVQLAKLFGKK